MRPRRFCISILITTLLLASCSSRSSETTKVNQPTERIVSSTPPFKTREPERYSAVRTVTFTSAKGESKTTKTEIARSQTLRREEEVGEPVFLLETEQGRFLVFSKEKIYAEVSGEPTEESETTESDNSPERLLHTGTLTSTYEKLGSEMVGGHDTTKYKVSVNNSSAKNVSNTETTIWLDEKLGMPVKSEAKATDGSKTVMELSNFEQNVDQSIFQIPVEFQKVTAAELRRRLKNPTGVK